MTTADPRSSRAAEPGAYAGGRCKCGLEHAVVVQRNYNCSAFNGYRRTWSPYSLVLCTKCHRGTWRTKAKYVDDLPDQGSAGTITLGDPLPTIENAHA